MKFVDDIRNKIEDVAVHFIESIKEEARDTKEAGSIIGKYFTEGSISDGEEEALKKQMWDTLKIFGVVVPFFLIPGASIIIPILVRVAKKNKIDLLPSSFEKDHKKKKNGTQTDSKGPTQQEV